MSSKVLCVFGAFKHTRGQRHDIDQKQAKKIDKKDGSLHCNRARARARARSHVASQQDGKHNSKEKSGESDGVKQNGVEVVANGGEVEVGGEIE